jgi:hypothetical protein
MFEHLIAAEDADFTPVIETEAEEFDTFIPLQRTTPAEHIDAKMQTADWMKDLGVVGDEEAVTQAEQKVASETFAALTAGADKEDSHALITRLDTPPAVKHLVGMLTAFDWEFVHRAQEIRGYAVSQLLEETKHPDAKIRLKALELLGKVTEVALFTERVEVKKTDISEEELDRKIKDKLRALELMSDAEVVEETRH